MTTYNTGNPVGSTDVRDLYDNAQNLDSLVNGPLASYADRLGVPRKSWKGLEQDFAAFLAASGFELPALEYVGGSPLVVDRPTQLIFRTGFPDTLYGVKSTEPFPATLTGTWATDESRLVVRSDGYLRQDLANSTDPAKGAGLVGFDPAVDYSGGVAGELNANSPTIPARTVTLSEVMAKTNTGGTLVINCYGDSMTYGFDTLSTTGDLQPGINGSSATRALYQYPEALAACMTKAGFSVTANNYGFPGDTSENGRNRFPSAVYCDVAIVMFGHNDAKVTGGVPAVTPERFKENIVYIVRREQKKGAFVILLKPPRLKESNYTGANLDRQRYMRLYAETVGQIAEQMSIPCVDVDEIVRHRGAEIYSDPIHFNKYGYNEWGWNLAALFIQRGEPITVTAGTVVWPSGASFTGSQTLFDGKTRMQASTGKPICISGYFAEDVILRTHSAYSTGVGGTQRMKITMDGGTRNRPVSRTRVYVSSAAPGRVGSSDIIHAGYRVFFLEVAWTTTFAYVDHFEFVSKSAQLLTDSALKPYLRSSLTGLALPLAADVNRYVTDDGMSLDGDFEFTFNFDANPGAGDKAGLILISEFAEATALQSRSIDIIRIASGACLVRFQESSNVDSSYPAAFTATTGEIKVVRSGNDFSIYADGVLLITRTTSAFGRLIPGIIRNNAAITVNYAYAQ